MYFKVHAPTDRNRFPMQVYGLNSDVGSGFMDLTIDKVRNIRVLERWVSTPPAFKEPVPSPSSDDILARTREVEAWAWNDIVEGLLPLEGFATHRIHSLFGLPDPEQDKKLEGLLPLQIAFLELDAPAPRDTLIVFNTRAYLIGDDGKTIDRYGFSFLPG